MTTQTTKLDKYNRTIEPGQLVVWATGWSQGPRFGIVKKLCRQRIRVEYKYQWQDRQGDKHWHATDILQQPSRLIIVDESLPSTLTMQLLKQG